MNPPPFDVDALLTAYDRLDAALVRAGFPATSPWWRAEIERFFRARKRRWVIRAGRRAGKSSTLCRVAVAWALAGAWHVPPGDTAVIPFFSLDRDEASGRIRTIQEILTALKVPHEPSSDEIYLPGKRLKFAVKTCSVRAVGYTSVACFSDEMARWSSKEDQANPAKDVAGSYRPTMATQPHAFEVCSSSPWSMIDYHAELFDQGETEHQITSFGATWTCNPTVSESDTHAFEPDERIWSREYAAIPSNALAMAFDPALIDPCFARKPRGEWFPPVAIIDPAGDGADAYVLGFARWCHPVVEPPSGTLIHDGLRYDEKSGRQVPFRKYTRWVPGEPQQTDRLGRVIVPAVPSKEVEWVPPDVSPVLCLYSIEEIPEAYQRDPTSFIAREARRHGARHVIGDNYYVGPTRKMIQDAGLGFTNLDWNNRSKVDAVARLRRLMRSEQLSLVYTPKFRAELHNFVEKFSTTGVLKYEGRSGSHDDYATTLLLAIRADYEGYLPGSPLYNRGPKHITDGA